MASHTGGGATIWKPVVKSSKKQAPMLTKELKEQLDRIETKIDSIATRLDALIATGVGQGVAVGKPKTDDF
jgi:hypothetical protein